MQDCTLKLDAVNIFIPDCPVRCQEKFFNLNAKSKIQRRKSGAPLKIWAITARCILRVNSFTANCLGFFSLQRYRDRTAGLPGLC
jgi:hypothetical protein